MSELISFRKFFFITVVLLLLAGLAGCGGQAEEILVPKSDEEREFEREM
jgi:hypothetical protein